MTKVGQSEGGGMRKEGRIGSGSLATRVLLREMPLGMSPLLLMALWVLSCHPKEEPEKKDTGSRDSETADTGLHKGDSTDSEDSGETGESGETAESGETGDTGESKDSEETGESGETGDSSDSETGVDDTDDTGTRLVDIDEAASLIMYYEETGEQLGTPFVLGDVTGDGVDDFCFLAYRADPPVCYGFRSPSPSGLFEARDADFAIQIIYSPSLQAPGDVNGDGIADLGFDNYILLGPVLDEESEETTDITILFEGEYNPGAYQTNSGDSDGDGLDDYLFELSDDEHLGRLLYLFSDVEFPTISLDDAMAEISFYPGTTYDYGFLGDTNGDGFDDIHYGSNKVMPGPITGDILDDDWDVGLAYSCGIGYVGDVNGDGYDDIGAAISDGWYDPWQVKLFLSPIDSWLFPKDSEATISIEGAVEADYIWDVVGVGDQNGDSLPDIGFIYSDRASGFYDVIYLFNTPMEGALTDSDAAMILQSSDSRLCTTELKGNADFTGDGTADDFLIGDRYNDAFAYHGGVGWVMMGGTFP